MDKSYEKIPMNRFEKIQNVSIYILNKTNKDMVNASVYNRKVNAEKWFIVFDGTSYYEVMGFDVDDEIAENEVEVVSGPWNNGDALEDEVMKLNDEAHGTHMYR